MPNRTFFRQRYLDMKNLASEEEAQQLLVQLLGVLGRWCAASAGTGADDELVVSAGALGDASLPLSAAHVRVR